MDCSTPKSGAATPRASVCIWLRFEATVETSRIQIGPGAPPPRRVTGTSLMGGPWALPSHHIQRALFMPSSQLMSQFFQRYTGEVLNIFLNVNGWVHGPGEFGFFSIRSKSIPTCMTVVLLKQSSEAVFISNTSLYPSVIE